MHGAVERLQVVSGGSLARGTVCVFAKPPTSGHAKTRLAAVVGQERASALAAAFLADTWSLLERCDAARLVLATTDPQAEHGVPGERWDQGDGDLGARMERVLRRALIDAPWALAVGADSPGLPVEHLRAAADALERHDAVLGPSRDGGYWCLGLRRCPEGLLADLPWSRSDTCEATARRLGERGLSVAFAPPWFDLDEPADLEHFREQVPVEAAPRTWALL